MNEKRKPVLGDLVHYQRYGSPGGEHLPEPSPAIITKVHNEESGMASLFVMNPNGTYFVTTELTEEPKPGFYSYPVKS